MPPPTGLHPEVSGLPSCLLGSAQSTTIRAYARCLAACSLARRKILGRVVETADGGGPEGDY